MSISFSFYNNQFSYHENKKEIIKFNINKPECYWFSRQKTHEVVGGLLFAVGGVSTIVSACISQNKCKHINAIFISSGLTTFLGCILRFISQTDRYLHDPVYVTNWIAHRFLTPLFQKSSIHHLPNYEKDLLNQLFDRKVLDKKDLYSSLFKYITTHLNLKDSEIHGQFIKLCGKNCVQHLEEEQKELLAKSYYLNLWEENSYKAEQNNEIPASRLSDLEDLHYFQKNHEWLEEHILNPFKKNYEEKRVKYLKDQISIIFSKENKTIEGQWSWPPVRNFSLLSLPNLLKCIEETELLLKVDKDQSLPNAQKQELQKHYRICCQNLFDKITNFIINNKKSIGNIDSINISILKIINRNSHIYLSPEKRIQLLDLLFNKISPDTLDIENFSTTISTYINPKNQAFLKISNELYFLYIQFLLNRFLENSIKSIHCNTKIEDLDRISLNFTELEKVINDSKVIKNPKDKETIESIINDVTEKIALKIAKVPKELKDLNDITSFISVILNSKLVKSLAQKFPQIKESIKSTIIENQLSKKVKPVETFRNLISNFYDLSTNEVLDQIETPQEIASLVSINIPEIFTNFTQKGTSIDPNSIFNSFLQRSYKNITPKRTEELESIWSKEIAKWILSYYENRLIEIYFLHKILNFSILNSGCILSIEIFKKGILVNSESKPAQSSGELSLLELFGADEPSGRKALTPYSQRPDFFNSRPSPAKVHKKTQLESFARSIQEVKNYGNKKFNDALKLHFEHWIKFSDIENLELLLDYFEFYPDSGLDFQLFVERLSTYKVSPENFNKELGVIRRIRDRLNRLSHIWGNSSSSSQKPLQERCQQASKSAFNNLTEAWQTIPSSPEKPSPWADKKIRYLCKGGVKNVYIYFDRVFSILKTAQDNKNSKIVTERGSKLWIQTLGSTKEEKDKKGLIPIQLFFSEETNEFCIKEKFEPWGDLLDLMKKVRYRNLPLEDADKAYRALLVFFMPVLYSLQFLHNKGVAHSDIKPQNIQLCWENTSHSHKIVLSDTDYATSKGNIYLTWESGTEPYTPPRPNKGTVPFSLWTYKDCYASGIVMMELALVCYGNQKVCVKKFIPFYNLIKTLVERDQCPFNGGISQGAGHVAQELLAMQKRGELPSEEEAQETLRFLIS